MCFNYVIGQVNHYSLGRPIANAWYRTAGDIIIPKTLEIMVLGSQKTPNNAVVSQGINEAGQH